MESSSSPLVSVVVPVYNAEGTILKSISEIAGQSLGDIEIICIDDGSTDSTGEILDELARGDKRIIVLHQENKGAGAARNTGLEIARGKYLSILDADDVVRANMLSRAVSVAEADDLDIVVFRSDAYYPDKGKYRSATWTIHEDLLPPYRVFAGVDVQRDVFKAFVGWAWDKLFRTDFIRENNLSFQEIRTTNDMLFVFSAVVLAKRISVIHDVLIHHVKQSEGTLSVTREKSWQCFHEALSALKERLISEELYERFERDYINYCVHASLWNINTLAEPSRSKLLEKLRSEWAEEMGIVPKDPVYFYHDKEYQAFMDAVFC